MAVLLGLIWAVAEFRQKISVDPYLVYDSSDPFSQRFSISNGGPFAIQDVHYACAITHIETAEQQNPIIAQGGVPIMIPTTAHIAALEFNEKQSTDCDFITRYGQDLRTVRVEIIVFYHRWPIPKNWRQSWKFSAKRDSGGKFFWDYGSSDGSIFEEHPGIVQLIPFDPGCEEFDVPLALQDIDRMAYLNKKAGRTVIVTTMLPCDPAAGLLR